MHEDHFSKVVVDINCMRKLFHKDYKYLINLNGNDFPLKTNYQLVQQLKKLNNTNLIPSVYVQDNEDKVNELFLGYELKNVNAKPAKKQFKHFPYYPEKRNKKEDAPEAKYVLVKNPIYNRTMEHLTNLTIFENQPEEYLIWEGSPYFAFTKAAIDFMLNTEDIRLKLFNFFAKTKNPERFVWAMINRLIDLPGANLDYRTDVTLDSSNLKYIKYDVMPEDRVLSYADDCYGKFYQGTCYFGALDVYFLKTAGFSKDKWFARNFDSVLDPRGAECLDVLIRDDMLDFAGKLMHEEMVKNKLSKEGVLSIPLAFDEDVSQFDDMEAEEKDSDYVSAMKMMVGEADLSENETQERYYGPLARTRINDTGHDIGRDPNLIQHIFYG